MQFDHRVKGKYLTSGKSSSNWDTNSNGEAYLDDMRVGLTSVNSIEDSYYYANQQQSIVVKRNP